jgi:response regulator of citrate/malate metabolism
MTFFIVTTMKTSNLTLQKFVQIVHESRQLTVRSIAELVNINRETVRKILSEDLDFRKVCTKMVPKLVNK